MKQVSTFIIVFLNICILYVDMVIRQCTKLIKDLEIQINSDESLRISDEQKHLLTVVNLLNIYLKEVLSIVAQLR